MRLLVRCALLAAPPVGVSPVTSASAVAPPTSPVEGVVECATDFYDAVASAGDTV